MSGTDQRIAMVGYTVYASDGRLKRHVANLLDAGFSVDVIAVSNPRGPQEKEQEGVRFFLPMARRYRGQGRLRIVWDYLKFTILAGFLLLWNHLFSQSYALVHINNMPNFLLVAALPLRILGVPIILDIHDTMPEIYQDRYRISGRDWMVRCLLLEERLCGALADHVLVTEDTKRARVCRNGVPLGKSDVVLNVPDPNLFPMPRLGSPDSRNKEFFRLVYHGTLTHRLGVDLAILALAEVRKQNTRVRLDIFGDGEQRQELEDLRRELELESVIGLSETAVPIEELAELLSGADLGVLPSRDNAATRLMLPVKLLEYVRLGIPCVTVPTETILYYFDESMLALVPPEDPMALAEKILFLCERPGERLRMAKEARKVLERYPFESERQRYRSIVKELVR